MTDPQKSSAESNDDIDLIIEPTAFTRAETNTTKTFSVARPATIVAIALFLVLAIVAGFMFSAKAVRLAIDPAPGQINITDGLPTWRLGERFLMLPGDYRVEARLPGYRVLSAAFVVGESSDQMIPFTMQKLPGIMNINSLPVSGAQVFVDQQLAGITPLRLEEIEPGIHDISIQAPRYLPFDTEVEIEGMRNEQQLEVVLEPGWANVTLTSTPAGADILVAGELLGSTPGTVEILEGLQEVELALVGYKGWTSSFVLNAGKDLIIPGVTLIKADGKVSILTRPEAASVSINGEYYGQSPIDVTLPPGISYSIEVNKAGYVSMTRKLSLQAAQASQVNLQLVPITGSIRFRVEPANSILFVDGIRYGTVPGKLNLTAKPHKLRITNEGFADYKSDILPNPDFNQQIVVRLKTVAQSEADAIPQTITTALNQALKLIVPGPIEMGASRREPGRRANEIEKSVILNRPFYMGIFEVTNGQFNKFDVSHDSGAIGRSLLNLNDRPVVNLSWPDAVRFCNWLSEQDNLEPAYELISGQWRLKKPVNTGYRLPTEAEWAFTARYSDGEPSRFPWGNNMPPAKGAGNFADEQAQHMAIYVIDGYEDSFRGPAPPGSFSPNNFGIFDLAGNVAEWTHDTYSTNPVAGELNDPIGPEEGNNHVIRGSSYMHGRFSELRWTFRDSGKDPRPDVGFRLVRYLE